MNPAPIDWAALEAPLDEPPLFFIEPKDKDPRDEVTRQQGFRKLLKDVAPGIKSWGVPNAGKRGFKAQQRAKREGLTGGVFDEHYAWNHGIAFLEWKDCDGMPSRDQIDWGNAMVRLGFRVACVRSETTARRLFEEWGALG